MNVPFGLTETITEIFRGLGQFVAELVPRLVTGLVVFLLGLLIAKIVERILRTTFVRLRIDALLDRVGITDTFQSLGIQGSIGESVARMVYYLIVILFLQNAADAVGLAPISNAITSFFAYLPNLVAALLVMVFGNVVAQFAGGAARRSAEDSGVDYAPALGNLVSASILFVVAIMAISQLGIDTAMIRTVVVLSLAGLSVGMALSFGLGSRETTRNLMAGFYARKLFKMGEEIEVGDVRGTLTSITATKALIEVDGRTVAVSNVRLADEAVTQ
ncbi:MAG: hypothetical protein DHS20C21_03270 [Gemmatimonadota bacterium]|nr:MAG: hypothetical protein DHS20C21_03270 [Gemmatimonadota bacterium]